MCFFRHSLFVLFATLMLSGSFALGEDRNLFRSLFGENAGQRSSSATPRVVNRAKRVEVDLTKQRLSAYEGNRLVLRTNISSGRTGNTPTGRFSAGPYKSEKHFSSLYHNAPMPWSVQITGHIFIHGFSVVPDYPASKGCVRVPISGRNPAKRLYNWIDVGTPIRIFY